MATTADLLIDSLGRVRETAHQVLDDTPEDLLGTPPAPGTNTIAWLVWHLSRGLDDQVAGALGLRRGLGGRRLARAASPCRCRPTPTATA